MAGTTSPATYLCLCPQVQIHELAGRRRELWVISGVIFLAVAAAFLIWGRREPARIAPPALASTGPSASSSAEAGLLVHVAGAVRAPGVYRFPDGARVADAIESAGGPRGDADLSGLNLAETLLDGSQIVVPRRGRDPRVALPAVGASPTSPVIDVNTADQVALETIPGVGPVTALSILQHRDAIGGFESIDQLLDVDGIGPATLEAIRPYVSI